MAKSSLLLLAFCLSVASATHAQSGTGLVIGTASDPSHAVLVGAKVVALEIHTRSARVTTTNSKGFYDFSQLQPGDYEVFHRLDGWIRRRIWSHRYKHWRNAGWTQLTLPQLYGEYELVRLLDLIPSLSSRRR